MEFAGENSPRLRMGHTTSTALIFSLPPGSSAVDLRGLVVLRAQVGGETRGAPAELEVSGVGPSLAGVSIRPEKLKLQVVDLAGPFESPQGASAGVQLAGAGVPGLFRPGAKAPTFNLLLRSDHGDTVHARLVDLTEGSEPTLATATVQINGNLAAGKYEGETGLSNLASEGPTLAIAVESGDSVVWAVLFVFLGALTGGGLYLASNRQRRKALLRDQVKSVLDLYSDRLKTLERHYGEGNMPLWSIASYLGADWYEVKWGAIVNFDGAVRTVWSEIHWARDDDDLSAAATKVAELRGRIIRWLTASNSVQVLEGAAALQPRSIPPHSWDKSAAHKDSLDLLQVARQIEPSDDLATTSLVTRIERQAHWHKVFARLWHAYEVLRLDMTNRPDKYHGNDDLALEAIDLDQLDSDGTPETGRTPEKQIDLERQVEDHLKRIRATYQGDAKDLDLDVASPEEAVEPSSAAARSELSGAMLRASDWSALQPDETKARRADAREGAPTLRGSAGRDHAGEPIRIPVRAIIRRDLAWTVAIALVSSIAYVLADVYSPAWGTATDYISAFVAGFAGKAIVSWAALPFFQSLRGAVSGAVVPGAAATASSAASTGTAATATPPGTDEH